MSKAQIVLFVTAVILIGSVIFIGTGIAFDIKEAIDNQSGVVKQQDTDDVIELKFNDKTMVDYIFDVNTNPIIIGKMLVCYMEAHNYGEIKFEAPAKDKSKYDAIIAESSEDTNKPIVHNSGGEAEPLNVGFMSSLWEDDTNEYVIEEDTPLKVYGKNELFRH